MFDWTKFGVAVLKKYQVYIEAKVSFEYHIEILCGKASQKLNAL